jgi:sec-independent protein translocase protein TatC
MSPAPERLVPPPPTDELERMSLFDHLEELRSRILWSLGSLLVAFIPCWTFRDRIFGFLREPIDAQLGPGRSLVYTGIPDVLFLYIKVSALAAVFLAAPVILFQIWRFVAPGLYRRERLYVLPFLVFGSLFFLGGGAFAYYVAFPKAVTFLLGMAHQFQPMIEAKRYFGFLMTIILGMGLMFELPVLVVLLSSLGLVTPRFLLRNFRWAVVIVFTVAAVITPTPDVLNLCLFAVPALVLYLLGIGVAWLVSPKRRAEAAEAPSA